MELKGSSQISLGLSPPNCDSDPEEKEISDDDDDDRNHKHRRRGTSSQSLERDPLEQTLPQPYRKRNRPFGNGQSNPHSDYNLDREFSKLEKRRATGASFLRFPAEHVSGRGRGRDYQRDSRFGNFDFAPQMALPGSGPSAMYPGRGLANVPNAPNASWNSFGLIPAIPNGAMDAINSLGMPILRPQLNPSLNMVIQRQRCRDFEERGFCLRGDMCPMEHGGNRIVVEDVQSLSQFNLPVSLPSAHVLGPSHGSGYMPSNSASSSSLIHGRGSHNRASKSTVDDALNMDQAFHGGFCAGADVYDPDQPLWNNISHETSTQLGLQPPNLDDSESLMDAELPDHVASGSGSDIGLQCANSSVWGRLRNSKNKPELKESFDSRTKPGVCHENRSKEILESSSGTQVTSHPGKQNNVQTFGPKNLGSTSKLQNDVGSKKPTQKAQRTLFVNCIPLKDNKKEKLFSHFRKFGEVIDIYIPANSERAFVQFSKREEAERALKAPDAVMGSRFIKLWWANRDSIPDEGISSGNNVSATSHDTSASLGSPHSVFPNKGKDNIQCTVSKVGLSKIHDNLVTAGNGSRPPIANGFKASPSAPKKMDSLEFLKELRKKQEMLEQKRNEFRQQLEKLAKHATGVQSEVVDGQATKQRVETSSDATKVGNSADTVVSHSSSESEMLVDKVSSVGSFACQRSKVNSTVQVPDLQGSKPTVRPVAIPYHANRYKLDNRPTSFRICAPLPTGLANVTAIRDHFSSYGDISKVEIEELTEEDSPTAFSDSEAVRNCSARISFAARQIAERAFLNGKSWHGHKLKFVWVTSNLSNGGRSSGEHSFAPREASSAENTTHDDSENASLLSTSNTSLHKLLNELPNETSRSFERGHSPVTKFPDKPVGYISPKTDEPKREDSEVPSPVVSEEHSFPGAKSPEKSGDYVSLETDKPERKDDEEHSPVATEEHLFPVANSPDKPVDYAYRETNELERKDDGQSPIAPEEHLSPVAKTPDISSDYVSLETDGPERKDDERHSPVVTEQLSSIVAKSSDKSVDYVSLEDEPERKDDEGHSPIAVEEHSFSVVNSPDKSTNYIPL